VTQHVEATLAELLTDDVVRQAVRSAGLTLEQFKEQLRDLASQAWRPQAD